MSWDQRDSTDFILRQWIPLHYEFLHLIQAPNLLFCFLHCSAGGLVTAVAPVVIKGNGLWVGWPGIHSKEPLGEIPESDPSDQTPTAGLRSDQVMWTLKMN